MSGFCSSGFCSEFCSRFCFTALAALVPAVMERTSVARPGWLIVRSPGAAAPGRQTNEHHRETLLRHSDFKWDDGVVFANWSICIRSFGSQPKGQQIRVSGILSGILPGILSGILGKSECLAFCLAFWAFWHSFSTCTTDRARRRRQVCVTRDLGPADGGLHRVSDATTMHAGRDGPATQANGGLRPPDGHTP